MEDAAASVMGHVTSIQAGYDRGRAVIFTNIIGAIEEVIKGTISVVGASAAQGDEQHLRLDPEHRGELLYPGVVPERRDDHRHQGGLREPRGGVDAMISTTNGSSPPFLTGV